MAIVRKLTRVTLDRDAAHTEVDCTYSIVVGADGQRLLQIDTYGSSHRKMPNKKSQSIRFSPEAIEQLRTIVSKEI
jgi:hypothetical protein